MRTYAGPLLPIRTLAKCSSINQAMMAIISTAKIIVIIGGPDKELSISMCSISCSYDWDAGSLLCSCLRWESWGTERLGDMSKATQLLAGWMEIQIQGVHGIAQALNRQISECGLWTSSIGITWKLVRNGSYYPCIMLMQMEVWELLLEWAHVLSLLADGFSVFKSLKEMGIPDDFTCLLRNLCS